MATVEVKVPDIGDFKDVPVIEVLVKQGDTVKPEDPLVTLESDKATMDVPSPAAGVVEALRVKVGDRVSEGSVLALLASEKGEKSEKSEKSEVVLAGTVFAVTDRYCRIDINGGKYEIDAREVIEIEELPVQDDKGGDEGKEKAPRIVLIRLDSNAVLYQLMPVQAAQLAAAGTWMWVVAPTPEKDVTEQGVM